MALPYQLQKTGQEIDDLLQKIDDLGPASSGSAGTMSAEDKAKLDGIEAGADENVIEGIAVGETPLTPSTNKTVTIPVDSEPTEGSENLVASGGVYDALSEKMDKDTSAGEGDIAVFNASGQVAGAFDVNEVVREGRIKQTTGQSTTDLMSQKAVTDELDTKAAKDEDAVEGNLAKFDANGNPVDAGIAAEKIAQKGEIQTYSGNLVDTRSAGTAQEFTYRKSGGDGVNWMRRIKGKSLVWNQQVNVETSTFSEVTITKNNDGTFTVSGSGTVTRFKSLAPDFGATGHKVLYIFQIISGAGIAVYDATNLSIAGGYINQDKKLIYTQEAPSKWTLMRQANADQDCRFSFIVIDLTIMFGDGKEPSTVAEFEALYNEQYHHYQPGVIKNNDAVAMESVGSNQWEEEWEVGSIDATTGANSSSATSIRTKNYIRVFPGVAYYNTVLATGLASNLKTRFYDIEKNYIGAPAAGGAVAANTEFVIPSNAAYFRFVSPDGYGDAYNHDICINLSDASRNGTYEPYWKKSIQLGLNALRVTDGTNIITVNGLKSAGSVYDEIDPVRKKYIKRIGEVDMGTLTWAYNQGTGYKFVTNSLSPASKLGARMLCTLYQKSIDIPYSTQRTDLDKKIGICTSGNNYWGLYVIDSAYTDAAAFKTAMSGVMLYYELATPVEYDLVDDIPNAIEVDENGTERAIFPEAVDPSAPFAADSNYSVSTANLVRKLNDAS